jgi:hypothetical protein
VTAEPTALPVPATAPDPAGPTAATTTPDADPGAGPSPMRRWPPWLVRPLAIYLVTRAITWGTVAVCALATHTSALARINRWDSRWFLRAATEGWPLHFPYRNGHVDGSTIAFFPLFPLSIRWLSHLTGMPVLAAGVVITSITGLTATVAVWLLVRHYADQRTSDRATFLVFLFPGSFVLTMIYSEGLVVTCLAFGLLALLQRRWVLAGLLGLLATATSPIAVAFEVSCLWCAYRAVTTERNWRSMAAPILAPLGFVAYQLWLWGHTGDLLAWRITERGGWNSYPSLVYPLHTVVAVLRDPIATNKTDDLLFVGIVVTMFAAVIAIRTRLPVPLTLYGISAAVLALVAAPVELRPRFIFLAFPLIIAVGSWLRGRSYTVVAVACAVLLIGLTAFEICSWQVFP